MTTTENILGVEYHESRDNLVIGGDGELFEQSETFLRNINQDFLTNEVGQGLAKIASMDWSELQADSAELVRLQEDLGIPIEDRHTSFDLVFGETVRASYMVLLGSAVRRAKVASQHKVTLDADQWVQAAFEDRDIGPFDGSTSDQWFEIVSGVENPEEQQRYLGYVATTLLKSNTLSSRPHLIAWRRDLATLHAHPLEPAS